MPLSGMNEIMGLYGGIEAGGTRFSCAVATAPDLRLDSQAIRLRTCEVPTTSPEETLGKVVDFFKQYDLKALGVASFGPIELRRGLPKYGYITTTPKPGWKDVDIVQRLQLTLGVPTGFDTDVNASALAEASYGAAKGLSDVVYITVGTGIGGGAVINGEMLHGLLHPEMGHLPIPRHPRDDYPGYCTFHRDCLEGMASGVAIGDRWKTRPDALPPDHEAWELEAYYLARGICAMVYTLSPQIIICGGGVMHQEQLFPLIRRQVVEMLQGYIQSEEITGGIDGFIVKPGLGGRSGLVGALELARRAEEADRRQTTP
jgi:fructokinase